jgi:hypothetical protein
MASLKRAFLTTGTAVLSFVLSLLTAACGGDAFAVGGAEAGAAGSSSGGDSGSDRNEGAVADGEAGAPSSWCSRQGAHLFCEDFSEGVPGLLSPLLSGGGAVAQDSNSFPPSAEPPRSLVATTPALTDLAGSASALGIITFTTEGGHDVLQEELDVSSTCFAHGNKDGVSVIALSFPAARYDLAVVVQSSAAELVEVTLDVDGGTSSVAVHPFSTPLPLDRWLVLNLDANLGVAVAGTSNTVTVKVNGLTVLANDKLTLVPLAGARHPTLGLGAAVKDSMSISSGCKVNVDEILFDVSLM